MFPRNDAVRNTPFDLILGTDRLLHTRWGGGGVVGGVRVSGGYNCLRGLILRDQFWNAQNVNGVGWVGKVLIHHTILKTQSAPTPPPLLGRSKRSVPWEL